MLIHARRRRSRVLRLSTAGVAVVTVALGTSIGATAAQAGARRVAVRTAAPELVRRRFDRLPAAEKKAFLAQRAGLGRTFSRRVTDDMNRAANHATQPLWLASEPPSVTRYEPAWLHLRRFDRLTGAAEVGQLQLRADRIQGAERIVAFDAQVAGVMSAGMILDLGRALHLFPAVRTRSWFRNLHQDTERIYQEIRLLPRLRLVREGERGTHDRAVQMTRWRASTERAAGTLDD